MLLARCRSCPLEAIVVAGHARVLGPSRRSWCSRSASRAEAALKLIRLRALAELQVLLVAAAPMAAPPPRAVRVVAAKAVATALAVKALRMQALAAAARTAEREQLAALAVAAWQGEPAAAPPEKPVAAPEARRSPLAPRCRPLVPLRALRTLRSASTKIARASAGPSRRALLARGVFRPRRAARSSAARTLPVRAARPVRSAP